ncbi:MAG: RNA pyrophosphohydrolase [Rickettsiales bacterium]|nr:RNA pyrophosphohydrolase [Rickettsiales bacterium]
MHERPYRLGMGIAVFNKDNKVFIGERMDIPGAWQLPQGGVTLQEIETNLIDAALRELDEETGIKNVELIAITKDWAHYDFIDQGYVPGHSHKYRGQRQKWLAVRYLGKDDEIDLTTHEEEIEFQNWRWDDLSNIDQLIVDFKRPIYKFVQSCFAFIPEEKSADLSKVIKL